MIPLGGKQINDSLGRFMHVLTWHTVFLTDYPNNFFDETAFDRMLSFCSSGSEGRSRL